MEYKLEFLSYLLIFKKKNERISKFDEQIKTCINIFEKMVVDEKDLIYLFEKNILDMNPCIRSLCWKLALKHLSLNTKKWNEELIEKKKLYEDYIKCFVINPLRCSYSSDVYEVEKKEDASTKLNEESETNIINSELFSQINKDTFRTRPELSFFNLNPQQTINNNIKILNSLINVENYEEDNEEIPFLVNINSNNNTNLSSSTNNLNNNENNSHFYDIYTNKEKNSIASTLNKNEKAVDNMINFSTDVNKDRTPNFEINSQRSNEKITDMHILKSTEPNPTDEVNLLVYKEDNNLYMEQKRNHVEFLSTESTSQNLHIGITNQSSEHCVTSKNYEKYLNHFSDVCDIVNPRRHYDLLCRILFIYAKIHPYVKYVQGMNEILAPLYFIIFNDPLCNCSLQGEADTFFCFIELMQRQRDVFCEGLDNTDDGINGKLKKFSLLLRIKEYEIWKKLYILKIETQYYALKWVLLLLTQEFDMADTIILYDHFIINNNENFILYICLVICMKLKSSLLCGNFSVNLKLLQNIPPFDPYDIIYEAKNLMNNDLKKNFNITDIYNNYICEKKRKNSLESLKSDNTVDVSSSSENLSNMYDCSISSNRRGTLLNNLRNKSIVQNIKNYISNKIDTSKAFDEDLDFDHL
ncbi:TBC domain protein, putative [Plasmodium malariae]|uniref:TBC domain protein, putative n=1 Tax=Plasmodium malariae TaxID=5858 RepID=A0A1C3L2F4_PLAMA|nr:TBC domain protein, putative [Plasmodium malariae]